MWEDCRCGVKGGEFHQIKLVESGRALDIYRVYCGSCGSSRAFNASCYDKVDKVEQRAMRAWNLGWVLDD